MNCIIWTYDVKGMSMLYIQTTEWIMVNYFLVRKSYLVNVILNRFQQNVIISNRPKDQT